MSAQMRVIRKVVINVVITASVVSAGLMIGARENPARADTCDHEACSTVCGMGVCTGQCFHLPGSNKNCNDADCVLTLCSEQ